MSLDKIYLYLPNEQLWDATLLSSENDVWDINLLCYYWYPTINYLLRKFIQYPTCTESGANCSTFDFIYTKKKKSGANPFMYGLSFVRQFLACIG